MPKLSDQARVDEAKEPVRTDLEDFTRPVSKGERVLDHERLPGREYPDPTPVRLPAHLMRRQVSMMEHMRNIVRGELLRERAEGAGFESFEDADDFDVDDEVDPYSTYEEQFDPEVPLMAIEEPQGVKGGSPAKQDAERSEAPAEEPVKGSE